MSGGGAPRQVAALIVGTAVWEAVKTLPLRQQARKIDFGFQGLLVYRNGVLPSTAIVPIDRHGRPIDGPMLHYTPEFPSAGDPLRVDSGWPEGVVVP